MEAALKKLFVVILLATSTSAPPAASAAPAGAAMLAPGIYTTADISRRCQQYTRRRVPDTLNDSSRQAVFLACVRKLSGGEAAAVAATPSPLVEAPVALPTYGSGWTGYGGACATDEGYGRRGSCDTY
jgi:hypothetical protein